jgi:hypothetical protein
MATVAADVDIRATPEAILDVLADLPHYPEWSAVHKRTHVDSRTADGRPERATMAVAAAGLTDEQTIDYHWHADGVDWDLVRSGQQRGQHGLYSITDGTDGTAHVHYELRIDPAIPFPAIIVRAVMKKAVTAATQGLKNRVESLS